MRVLFCTEAGGGYGFGHLRRCLAIIEEGGGSFDSFIHVRNGGLRDVRRACDGCSCVKSPDAALSRELVRTLEEARNALNALRQLAQEIEQNPSSLITGKKESRP